MYYINYRPFAIIRSDSSTTILSGSTQMVADPEPWLSMSLSEVTALLALFPPKYALESSSSQSLPLFIRAIQPFQFLVQSGTEHWLPDHNITSYSTQFLPSSNFLRPTRFDSTPSKPAASTHTMAYNARRFETLQRLGIEQLPTLYSDRINHKSEYSDAKEMIYPLRGNLPVRTMPVSNSSHDGPFRCTARADNIPRSPARDVRVASPVATQSG